MLIFAKPTGFSSHELPEDLFLFIAFPSPYRRTIFLFYYSIVRTYHYFAEPFSSFRGPVVYSRTAIRRRLIFLCYSVFFCDHLIKCETPGLSPGAVSTFYLI